MQPLQDPEQATELPDAAAGDAATVPTTAATAAIAATSGAHPAARAATASPWDPPPAQLPPEADHRTEASIRGERARAAMSTPASGHHEYGGDHVCEVPGTVQARTETPDPSSADVPRLTRFGYRGYVRLPQRSSEPWLPARPPAYSDEVQDGGLRLLQLQEDGRIEYQALQISRETAFNISDSLESLARPLFQEQLLLREPSGKPQSDPRKGEPRFRKRAS